MLFESRSDDASPDGLPGESPIQARLLRALRLNRTAYGHVPETDVRPLVPAFARPLEIGMFLVVRPIEGRWVVTAGRVGTAATERAVGMVEGSNGGVRVSEAVAGVVARNVEPVPVAV